MRYTVNVHDIENALVRMGGEAQAKDIQEYILHAFCRGSIPENYRSERSFRQTIQRKIEDYCPQAEGFNPYKREGKFLRVGHGIYRLAVKHETGEFPAIEEVPDPVQYLEGATKKIAVNYYERSAVARAQCIKHYGCRCVVCGFDFEEVYGELGKAFIHVHHVVPLSEIKENYTVNPIEDLRPVCANCHAIIHRTAPALSLEKVKMALTSAGKGRS